MLELVFLVGPSLLLVAHAGWLLYYAYLNRQFYKTQAALPLRGTWSPKVTVFMPCKGAEPGLEQNVEALLSQRYSHYEACFIVESESDPALEVIQKVQATLTGVPSRVVVAGLAQGCGQKVHNLILATQSLTHPTQGSEVEVLAFADSDSRPGPDWLRRLIDTLELQREGVVTGYRWYSPASPSGPNLLLACVNSLVLGLMGPTRFNLIWGGSWAIGRKTFVELGFPQAWTGALCDDLTVSRIVHASGRPVAFQPHCLSVSPADTTWVGLFEFARRQFLQVRIYAPGWWRGSCSTGLVIHLGLWTMLLSAAYGLSTGGRWLLPGAVGLGYWLVLSTRAWSYSSALRPFIRSDSRSTTLVQVLLTVFAPLVMLFNWLLLLSALLGRSMTWRGVRYRLDSPTHTTILTRAVADAEQPARTTVAP